MDRLMFRAWNGRAMEHGGFAVHATGKLIVDTPALTDVTEDSPVMQCTGLRDKNGVLIYEGDAWVTSEPIDNAFGESAGWLKFYRVVAWYEGGFCIRESSEDKNMDVDIYPLNEFWSEGNDRLDFLVTHNIYENPELVGD